VRQPDEIDLPVTVGLGLDGLQPRARSGKLDAEPLGRISQRDAVDDRLGQALLRRRETELPRDPADRCARHEVRIDQHEQDRAGAELRRSGTAEERQRPHHGAQRRGARRPRQDDAVQLRRRRLGIDGRSDGGALADGDVERAGSRLVDTAQPSLAIEPQPVG